MQTFLPFPDFERSAECLDRVRLHKQAVECIHIIGSILDLPKRSGGARVGYKNHPVVNMWRPFVGALIEYQFYILLECKEREIKSSIPIPTIVVDYAKYTQLNDLGEPFVVEKVIKYPHWLGDKRLHESHKSNLLRKNRDYYSQYFGRLNENLPYYYPS